MNDVLTSDEFSAIINSSQDEHEIVDRLMQHFAEPDGGIVEAMLREEETWVDVQVDPPVVTGHRCQSRNVPLILRQCVRHEGHEGKHRYTSSVDGRSVSWEDSVDTADDKIVRKYGNEDN